MTGKHRTIKNLALNLTLLLAICLIGLVFSELSLRFFYPKYEAAAEVEYDMDEFRIWKRTPNGRGTRKHPDTGLLHPLNYNNLALRQDRNFSEQDIRSATNIGFFGDSFTENIRIAAQYSFTEPLDYLLNIAGGGGLGVNVLNFGVDGYGPGQSFLHYKHFRYTKDLDYVFYVFCKNDLKNIYQTNLFQLNDKGKVIQNVPSPPSLWTTLVSRLHVSYLLLDVAQRLSVVTSEDLFHWHGKEIKKKMAKQYKAKFNAPTAEAILRDYEDENMDNADIRNSIVIFRYLISMWKKSVEDNGGKFYIVLLPRPFSKNVIPILGNDFNIVKLYDCFSEHNSGSRPFSWDGSEYHFKTEGHWNEAGNRLAAICLYRFLEKEMGLSTLSEGGLQAGLERYYSAFEQSRQIEERGQNPIRAKYSALTLDTKG